MTTTPMAANDRAHANRDRSRAAIRRVAVRRLIMRWYNVRWYRSRWCRASLRARTPYTDNEMVENTTKAKASAPDSVGVVSPRDHTFAHPPNPLKLDSGRFLGPITLRYETYGTLNADRSNAILVFHALSGSHHAAGYHSLDDKRPGWWDDMIGPGKGFDTRKFFVICSNFIGGCNGSTGPSSPRADDGGRPYGLDFPLITIGDMVEAQRHLIDHLGIERLYSVAGGSMGGMQALEWAIRYPDRVRSVVVLASTATVSAQGIAFHAVGRNAIMSDPDWNGGDYYHGPAPANGLSIARMIGHITYLSEISLGRKFGRTLQDRAAFTYEMSGEFQVESYLAHLGTRFVESFDANSYLYITKAMDYYDLSEAYGSLPEALGRTRATYLVASFTSDWLYPSRQSREIVSALMQVGREVSYVELESVYGHDAFLLESARLCQIVRSFLDNVASPAR